MKQGLCMVLAAAARRTAAPRAPRRRSRTMANSPPSSRCSSRRGGDRIALPSHLTARLEHADEDSRIAMIKASVAFVEKYDPAN